VAERPGKCGAQADRRRRRPGSGILDQEVHEVAGHTSDIVEHNVSSASSCPAGCDHNSGGQQSARYSKEWYLAGSHNGPHTITVDIDYSGFRMNGFPPGPISGRVSKTTTVDLQDVVVTAVSPPNPEPIPWDPEDNTPYTCTATATMCYKTNLPVTLSIYDTQQNLVKTYTQWQAVGIGPTQLSYVWDGSTNYGPPGTKAIRGLYLFRWEVGGPPSMPDYDCDKSTYLNITSTVSDAELVSSDGSTAVYSVRYTLTSAGGRSGSLGHIDVYGPALALEATHVLQPVDMTPGDHTVTFAIPCPPCAGDRTFLVSVRDGHADTDRAHRLRWALQHNQAGFLGGTIAFGYPQNELTQESEAFKDTMLAMGFRTLPPYPAKIEAPFIHQMRGALEFTQVTRFGTAKPLKTVAFVGHSPEGYEGYALTCNRVRETGAWYPRTIVPTRAFYNSYAAQMPGGTHDCLVLETVASPPSQFANLDMVVLCGCGLGEPVSAGLAEAFVAWGAKTVVAVGNKRLDYQDAMMFLTGIPTRTGEAHVPGFLDLVRTSTIGSATAAALASVLDYYDSHAYADIGIEGRKPRLRAFSLGSGDLRLRASRR
jgi:hypothetical protein